ncbi:Lysophospholipase L1 [Faunimonas pinastri]|uniref:Lysophospholipase L1 n=1 Tax=Faunimonas pinastri TaxID=1855383 RepID=A0A1H9MEM7_9HYPH|nr:Lysophospholipase L1 [Faunimonas pinastri]
MRMKANRLPGNAPWAAAALFGTALGLMGPGSAALADPVHIVAFGDSLTAGYGLGPGQSFPEQLEAALKAKGYDVKVDNAGVSGDTTTAALARVDWSVPKDAQAVIVELGGNDALRGIDPEVTRKNLTAILDKLTERDQDVLLAGMKAPPNMGPDFARAFNRIFIQVAAEERVGLYPFFLEGVAADDLVTQSDGIHPTAEGIAKIVKRITPYAEALVKAALAPKDEDDDDDDSAADSAPPDAAAPAGNAPAPAAPSANAPAPAAAAPATPVPATPAPAGATTQGPANTQGTAAPQ